MPKRAGKNLKLLIVGAGGRVGQEIVALAQTSGSGFEVSGEVGRKWPSALDPATVDIVIEFSSPEGLKKAREWCVQHKKALVSGTTGIHEADRKALKAAAKIIPVLYSANMSLGIAVLTAMLEKARAIEDWDFHVDEVHHNQKKDSPSGTALLLDQKLSETLGRRLPTPNSIRGGGVPGIHQVWALGPEEMLVLQHTAFNRKVFARGALKAARWLFDKGEPGFYDLSHLFTA